jgi:peroxiredoxin
MLKNLKTSLLIAGAMSAVFTLPSIADKDESSKLQVGDQAPEFTATLTDKTRVSSADYKNKVLLLTFFATWCPPCRAELPHVEKEAWQTLKDKGLAVLVVGREENVDDLGAFKKKENLTVPIAADPRRDVYGKFAAKEIPRNYVIDKSGKIVFMSRGFSPPAFDKMLKVIEKELKK